MSPSFYYLAPYIPKEGTGPGIGSILSTMIKQWIHRAHFRLMPNMDLRGPSHGSDALATELQKPFRPA